MQDELKKYLATAQAQGLSEVQIRRNLLSSGWPPQLVESALNPASAVVAPVYKPPQEFSALVSSPAQGQPAPQTHYGMWVVFEYVLMFITLATTTISFAGIGHYFVNDYFTTSEGYFYASGMSSWLLTWYASAIIVAFPIFAILFINLRKKVLFDPAVRNIKARKVFVYLALIWTFIAIITRVISSVFDFLNGDSQLTLTLAHLLVTIFTAGSVFIYFLLDMKKDSKTNA